MALTVSGSVRTKQGEVFPSSIFLVNQSIIKNLYQALIQISVFIDGQVHCYLFRICEFSLLSCPSLIRLLKSETLIKLGVGIDGDMKKLAKEFEPTIIQVESSFGRFFGPKTHFQGRYFDLRFAATHASIQPGGLASLVRQTLNRKLGK